MNFLDTTRQLPYCPGCGHPHVLKALDQALADAGVETSRLVLVTDIGCVGLADAYFPTLHTVHTLHGRSTAVAAGLVMGQPRGDGRPLKVVVLVGDGGASIGLLHLVHAAQLNVDLTVLVHNNLLYGMTGGQHSTLTPAGLTTTTTPDGNPLPPLDLAQVLGGAGCTFYARARAPGEDLVALLVAAMRHPGFAVVEALELCPTFAARIGGVTGQTLNEMAVERGKGTVAGRGGGERAPFRPHERPPEPDPLAAGTRPERAWGHLAQRVGLVVAGRAGERVQSAAKLVAKAALAAGLHATVRTDNPVTQGRGFSLAEVTLAPTPIDFTGMERPDVVIVTADEGRAVLAQEGRLEAGAGVRFVVDPAVGGTAPPGAQRRDLRGTYGPKQAALGGLVEEVLRGAWWEDAAFHAAFQDEGGAAREEASKLLDRARASLVRTP